jgi:hypothetical protein
VDSVTKWRKGGHCFSRAALGTVRSGCLSRPRRPAGRAIQEIGGADGGQPKIETTVVVGMLGGHQVLADAARVRLRQPPDNRTSIPLGGAGELGGSVIIQVDRRRPHLGQSRMRRLRDRPAGATIAGGPMPPGIFTTPRPVCGAMGMSYLVRPRIEM